MTKRACLVKYVKNTMVRQLESTNVFHYLESCLQEWDLAPLFSCKLCPKRFCQLNKLNRHMITHNKLKRYICSACKKSFSRSDTLKNHVKVFHNEAILKMFTCNICPKTYHYKKDLNRHIKIVHSTK